MNILLLAALLSGSGDKVVVVAGGGSGTDRVPAVEAKLFDPFAVDFDKAGNMYIVEMQGFRVLRVDPKGLLTVIAGTGAKGFGGDGGPASKAQFDGMHHLIVAPDGDLFISDTWNNRVRRLDLKEGVVTTFAGTGQKGFSGDGGPAAKAQFGAMYCAAIDSKGARMFVADLDNRRIRAIDMKTGAVTTVAGNGQKGVPADGAVAKEAPLSDPRAVAVDSKGRVYVLERGGHALRVVEADGRIRTVAGTGRKGFNGDGGDALKAEMNGPKYLTVDGDDDVLIVDSENHAIRKYQPRDGKIVRVAGSGKKGSGGVGGPADKIELNRPHGVTVHSTGIYISDSDNHRVLKIEP